MHFVFLPLYKHSQWQLTTVEKHGRSVHRIFHSSLKESILCFELRSEKHNINNCEGKKDLISEGNPIPKCTYVCRFKAFKLTTHIM